MISFIVYKLIFKNLQFKKEIGIESEKSMQKS